MKKCPNCSKDIKEEAKFCPFCGGQVVPQVESDFVVGDDEIEGSENVNENRIQQPKLEKEGLKDFNSSRAQGDLSGLPPKLELKPLLQLLALLAVVGILLAIIWK